MIDFDDLSKFMNGVKKHIRLKVMLTNKALLHNGLRIKREKIKL
jgi:hypothetical protein